MRYDWDKGEEKLKREEHKYRKVKQNNPKITIIQNVKIAHNYYFGSFL